MTTSRRAPDAVNAVDRLVLAEVAALGGLRLAQRRLAEEDVGVACELGELRARRPCRREYASVLLWFDTRSPKVSSE